MARQLEVDQIRQAMKIARVEAGLTQERAAEKLGITRVWLSFIETGSRPTHTSPSFELIMKMSQVYKVPMGKLLGGS